MHACTVAAALLVTSACSTAPGAAPAGSARSPAVVPLEMFNPADLRHDLEILASDSFRGRETGTPDALRAARFLADRLGALGLEPAGDSGFFQRVPVTRQTFTAATSIRVTERGRPTSLLLQRDILPLLSLDPTLPLPRLAVDGDLVFAGYAMRRASGVDDLSGLDVAGKVVVVVNGAPAGTDSATRASLESEAQIGPRLFRLLALRPAGIIVMLEGASSAYYGQLVPQVMRSMSLAPASDSTVERSLPLIAFSLPRAGSPLLPAGWPQDDRAQVLRGRRFSATIDLGREDAPSYNVVAIARGRDRALAGSYVAFGAHYDHIGILPAVDGDSIANGADDDGSGSVTLLALAKSFARFPVRRSVLLVWHVGEEQGLFGSQWFTDHPTVPIDSIVAQVNADMIGRNAPDSLYVVGPRAAPRGQSRRLGELLDSVNVASAHAFHLDARYDSPTDPEQLYLRSDHYNYARKGIPIVFVTSGLHPDYHAVTDEVSRIDFEKLARVARLLRDVGIAVGDGNGRPR